MKKLFKNILIISIVSLILHYAWESWQCDIFYTMGNTINHTRLMASATLGDILMTIVLYIILAIVNKNSNWIIERWSLKDFLIIILYGLFMSFYYEVSALYTGRWGYSNLMPLFPNTNIGLVPVVQLLLLFPLTFIISRPIIKLFTKKSIF